MKQGIRSGKNWDIVFPGHDGKRNARPPGGNVSVTLNSDYWRYLFPLELAGTVFLAAGLIAVRRRLSLRLNGLVVLGRVFVAASLATFGAEHLTSARSLMQIVPEWMPGRLFWTYFVGLALFAAAASFVLNRYVRLSASLLGLMFFLFWILLDVPAVPANLADRFTWALFARELFFALGAWALAASQFAPRHRTGAHRMVAACRVLMGAVLVFYSVEHFLHPEFAPGVPLEQVTLAIIPFARLWGYLAGAALLVGGVAMLANRHARAAATWLGIAMALLVPIIYVPMLVVARQPLEITVAINYIFDTLLFAGSILFLAEAIPASPAAPSDSGQGA